MPPGPTHLHIADVLTAVPAQMGVEAGMVVLTEDDQPFRSLRIIIGPTEANAILAGWRGAVPGRPATWDLFVSAVAILGGRIDRVVITAVQEERHFFAHVEMEQAGERRILACRPSDAIALAVRSYNAAILAEPDVLDAAGVLPDGTKPGAVPAATEADGGPATLAEREAALAAREQALAAREQALAESAAHSRDPEVHAAREQALAESAAHSRDPEVQPPEVQPPEVHAARERALTEAAATPAPAEIAEALRLPEAAGPPTGPPAPPG